MSSEISELPKFSFTKEFFPNKSLKVMVAEDSSFFKPLKKIFFVGVHHVSCVQLGAQLVGVGSLLLPCGSQG